MSKGLAQRSEPDCSSTAADHESTHTHTQVCIKHMSVCVCVCVEGQLVMLIRSRCERGIREGHQASSFGLFSLSRALVEERCRRVWLVTVKAALGCVCVCVFTAHVTETSSITDTQKHKTRGDSVASAFLCYCF